MYRQFNSPIGCPTSVCEGIGRGLQTLALGLHESAMIYSAGARKNGGCRQPTYVVVRDGYADGDRFAKALRLGLVKTHSGIQGHLIRVVARDEGDDVVLSWVAAEARGHDKESCGLGANCYPSVPAVDIR